MFEMVLELHGTRHPAGSGAAAPDSAPTRLFAKESESDPGTRLGTWIIKGPGVASGSDSDSDSLSWERAGCRHL